LTTVGWWETREVLTTWWGGEIAVGVRYEFESDRDGCERARERERWPRENQLSLRE